MLHRLLEQRLQQAVATVLSGANTENVLVRPCPDPKFGDYQSNALMAVAKERKMNPRQLATDVVAKLDVSEWCDKVEIAGAGFLNFRLKTSALAQAMQAAIGETTPFVQKTTKPQTVVIDFSSPNVAKSMHVGHIRSTILGDSLARTLRLLGHRVVTDNHIGDWGTQFGKLLVGWKHLLSQAALEKDPISEMEQLYKLVNFACELPRSGPKKVLLYINRVASGEEALIAHWTQTKAQLSVLDEDSIKKLSNCAEADFVGSEDAAFKATVCILKKNGLLTQDGPNLVSETAISRLRDVLELAVTFVERHDKTILEAARQELVKLQDGDEENLRIWKRMIALSQVQFDTVYGRLGVKFDHTFGESYYNERLKGVVQDLVAKGIARETEGAIGVFSDGTLPPKQDPFLKQEDGETVPNPCLIQKSDGAANYATTDLATLQFRMEGGIWNAKPDEIIYVTDGRQQLHFQQIFATFRRWQPETKVRLAHVWFGSINGDDGKPFKTRSGDTIKLSDLLDEAEERAFKVVTEKNAELPEAQKKEIARVVGLGAIKYADLMPNRQSDYIFSWDKMLALQGNTAPYLQYAYARVRSIFRKAAESAPVALGEVKVNLAAPEELRLAKHLLNFGLTLESVTAEHRPNYLCNYLYELASHYSSFWEACPVLKAATENEKQSRLVLCELTARVLKEGLGLLGIEVMEQM